MSRMNSVQPQQQDSHGAAADVGSDMKMVQVNSDKLKKLNNDPVAAFLDTVNQLQFIIDLPPTLDKDIRQIKVENFHRALFNKTTNGAFIKNEILKLQNGSREPLSIKSFNSCLKNVSTTKAADDFLCSNFDWLVFVCLDDI